MAIGFLGRFQSDASAGSDASPQNPEDVQQHASARAVGDHRYCPGVQNGNVGTARVAKDTTVDVPARGLEGGNDEGESRGMGSKRTDSWFLPTGLNGMRVTFQDVTYHVPSRGKKSSRFTILDHVSAYFSPQQMTAVMGPSGSGKSTLLDVLAGRKTVGQLEGKVLFAGVAPTRPFLRRYTGYVEQNDTLLPELSVREMLLYTAGLALPRKDTSASKVERVERLLEVLGLVACQHTLIGDPLSRGISGGQAKRTNIGVALVTEPRVLFLDEPTSGLDSYTAHQVMEVVKLLVSQGITICATIHCPPPQTFRLFEAVLILQRGRIAYFGTNGQAAIDYFHQFPQVPRKAAEDNVAEWLIHITTDADRQGDDIYVTNYRTSGLKKSNDANLELYVELESANVPDSTRKALATKKANTNPVWWSVIVMLRARTPRNYTSGYYLFGRWFDKSVFTFMLFTFYWRVGSDESAVNIPNIAGAMFMWVVLPAFGAGPYLPGIVLERPVYLREMQDGLYGPAAYLGYKMTEEGVMAFIMSIVFTLPTFYTCNFQGSFFVVWLAWLISLCNGIGFAYAAAALSPTMDIASAMLLTIPTGLLFAAGFVIRYADIPRPWIWLPWINWMWYGFGALMINQFGDIHTQVYGEDTVLSYYGLDGISAWAFLAYSGISALVFVLIAYGALVFVRHQKR